MKKTLVLGVSAGVLLIIAGVLFALSASSKPDTVSSRKTISSQVANQACSDIKQPKNISTDLQYVCQSIVAKAIVDPSKSNLTNLAKTCSQVELAARPTCVASLGRATSLSTAATGVLVSCVKSKTCKEVADGTAPWNYPNSKTASSKTSGSSQAGSVAGPSAATTQGTTAGPNGASGSDPTDTSGAAAAEGTTTVDAGAVTTSIDCDNGGVKVSGALGVSGKCVGGGSDAQNPIYALIAIVVQYATGVFGLIFVLMIVIAGLQYTVSGGSPDTAKQAKDRIRNSITGLVLLLLMFGILQLILPANVKLFAGS